MLFGKSKNKDKPAKQAAVSVDDLGNSRKGEDLLTESLFQDTPPGARENSMADKGLIIDIDAAPPVASVSNSDAAVARPAKVKKPWFGKASKPVAAAPAAPTDSRDSVASDDDFIIDMDDGRIQQAAVKIPASKLEVPPAATTAKKSWFAKPAGSTATAPVAPLETSPSSILSDEDFIIDIQAERAKPVQPKKAEVKREIPAEPPKPKRRWFAGKTKASSNPTKKPEKEPVDFSKTLVIKDTKSKKAKPSPKIGAKKSGVPVDPFIILEIGGARTLYWQLTAQGIETREGIPEGESAISFTTGDLRYAVDETLSNSKALTTVEEDMAEPAYIINRSKELKAIYATQQLRFAELPYRIGPGVLVLDSLYTPQATSGAAAIIGFQLKDAADKDAVVILYYREPSGELSEPQISIYPDNLEFVLSQFATANTARADSKIELFDNAALRQAASVLSLYPNQSMFAGISTQAAWKYAAAATVLLAICAVSWSAYNYQLTQQYSSELLRHKQETKALTAQAQTLLEGSARSLAHQLSLQLDSSLARSNAFWVPGSKVRLAVDGGSSDYWIRLPLSVRAAGKSQIQVTPEDVVEQLRTLPVPAGCLRKDYSFSGALNEVSLSIHCEDTVSSLTRYRSR